MYKLLILCLMISGCGIKIKTDIPKKIEVTTGADLEKIFAVCDNRYGKKTVESEKCINLALNYLSLKLAFDPDAIINYCTNKFPGDQQAIDQCQDDLGDLFSGNQTP